MCTGSQAEVQAQETPSQDAEAVRADDEVAQPGRDAGQSEAAGRGLWP